MIGGDSQQEGLAGYRLGNAHEEIGDAETAILVRTFLKWHQKHPKTQCPVII